MHPVAAQHRLHATNAASCGVAPYRDHLLDHLNGPAIATRGAALSAWFLAADLARCAQAGRPHLRLASSRRLCSLEGSATLAN